MYLTTSRLKKTKLAQDFLVEHPNVNLHYPPTYSSWLNQVEIWFSHIEREVISRGVFASVSNSSRKLKRYITGYSARAEPFKWKYYGPSRHYVSFATRH